MRHLTAATMMLIALLAMSTLGGCDRGGASEPDVVVVDLQRVAQEVGRGQQIDQQIQQAHSESQQRIQAVQAELQQALQQRAQAHGATPTDAQRQEMDQARAEAQQRFNQTVEQAQAQTEQLAAMLLGQFRNEVQAIARAIARDRGASVVLAADPSLLDYSPNVDITDAVIVSMRSSASNSPAPVMPQPGAPGAGGPAPAPWQGMVPPSPPPAQHDHSAH